jgi:hypothetical protein
MYWLRLTNDVLIHLPVEYLILEYNFIFLIYLFDETLYTEWVKICRSLPVTSQL